MLYCYGVGNLTNDPELRHLPSGSPVAEVGLAFNRKYTDNEGNKQEQTDYIQLKCFGKPADNLVKYCKKGRQVFVTGRIRLEKWTSQDGTKRSKHTLQASSIRYLGPHQKPKEAPQAAAQGTKEERQAADEVDPGDSHEDDMPF